MSFSIEDRAVHNIKEKRLKKSQEKNPLYKKKTTAKPERDVKPKVSKLKTTTAESGEASADPDLDKFAGFPSEKGSNYRTRPLWKMRADSANHNKTVKSQKKELRKQRINKDIQAEKRQIERPKQGKKKEVNVDHTLVNKYLKLLHKKDDAGDSKPRRSKWYTG